MNDPAIPPSVGRLENARTLYSGCPLCESPNIEFLLDADCTRHALYQPQLPPTMRWQRCRGCAHVFTEGYFTPEAEAIVFSRVQENQRVGYKFEQLRHMYGRMVERVARSIDPGDWLDVGFGDAALIFTADEFGFRTVGLDLREENVAALRQMGFEAYLLPIETYDAPGRFSVLSMADVLEHMPFPKVGLAAAHRLLHPGGMLYLSMPNMDATLWRALDAQSANPYWGELEHYHNFGRRRLLALLEEQGFEPCSYAVSERYRVGMEVLARRL